MMAQPQHLRHTQAELDEADKAIINRLQEGLPLEEHPFATIARELKISENEIIDRLQHLKENGVLTRFGPMYHAERMGGALTLAAMKIPEQHFDWITEIVNDFPEVAHNYKREHEFNMWFVVATETPERVQEVIEKIEWKTGFKVYNMPKVEEFYVGLKLSA